MATAQKPRTKKKKRTREKRDDDPVIDFVFPATATRCDDVLSHDCFVSAEFKALTTEVHPDCTPLDLEVSEKFENISIVPKKELSLIGDTKTQVEIQVDLKAPSISEVPQTLQNQEPSAPIMEEFPCVSTQRVQFLPVVKYPDLSYIKANEVLSQNQTKYNIKSDKTKPFTSAQLREIYFCKELDIAKQFEVEFLENSLQETFSNDPLYNRILQYSILRSKLKVNIMDAQSLQKTFTEAKSSFWDMEDKSINFNGVCGDGITVKDTDSYKVAMLNLGNVETACISLDQLHELVCLTYTTNLVFSQVIRMQIEQIIREILTYPVFLNKNQNASVSLRNKPDTDSVNCISHLRRAISILFVFVRKPFPDKVFLNDIRSWITKLVALHLRIATKEDHWFLLLHILRCPSGVSLWATSFLQVPEPNINEINVLNSLEVNHCIAVLSILLMPIKRRNEFLKAFSQSHKAISDPVKEDLWILVDSDGEEGSNSFGECLGLKESDLIAFLNQIPFESLITAILNIEKKNYDYIILSETISGYQVIKVIAFNSTLIELLGQGLITYNTERYKQFAKRLGRLIRHSIQYISDLLQIFMESKLSKSPELCDRLNVEFNAFVIKACSYIYKTRNLGTWQYFSSLPFAALDSDAIWQLLYYLNVGFPAELSLIYEEFRQCFNASNFWEKFNTSIADILPEDLYYILQSFFEIAVERDPVRDLEIIQSICSHIFVIGFINGPTKEICYKTCRDMLINLTNVYPDLISNLMYQIKNRFLEIDNILYLLKSLPLDIWKPEMEAYEILANWLLNYNYEALENLTARLIISRLNWGFDRENNLFLPYDIHVRMASLICEASTKHTPELVGSSGISESVRQVSSFAENQTNKDQFVHWCWNIASTLRLHLMDQNPETIKFTLQNPSVKLSHIAELENLGPIFQGVSENRPLAIYFSILLSLWGHSVPLICQKGFPKLRFLLNDYRHSVVIRCIQLIVPLFLDCSDTLRTSESFQELLKALLTADRTYIKMAKELISSTSPGPVLELMQNMTQAQLIYYTDFGLSTPTPLINLWLQILTNVTIWQNPNAAYLVDNILKIAYQFPDSWQNATEYFRALYKSSDEWKISKGSALKMLLGSTTQAEKPPAVSTDCPWLAVIILQIEFETQELQTSLWPELLRQLSESTGKTNVDNLLKKTSAIVGCPSFPASTLVLYKYANLISSLDVKHPLFPIISQKFFRLYLARVPFSTDEERFQHIYGVSDKFYEHNISLMKKIKSKFKQADEYYVNLASRNAENEVLAYLHTSCAKLMKTYLLWLEETSLNKISKNQTIDLPPQFNVEKLKDLFLGDNRDWTEFLHFPTIRQEQSDCALRWLKMFYKLPVLGNTSVNITTLKSTSTPLQRIKNHFQSYDKPIKAPELIIEPLILESMTPRDINKQTLTILQNYFKVIDKFSKEFNLTVKELNALTGNYKDLIPLLYKNVPYKERRVLKCTSILSNFIRTNCAKPAEIFIDLEKPQKNVSIEQKIESNREKHDTIIKRLLEQNVGKFVIAMQNMEHIVKYLKTFKMVAKNSTFDSNHITDVAVQFFFDVIKNYNENLASFPPANELCSSLLSELGFFIQEQQETQGIRILYTALKRPELLNVLSELFVPSRTSPEYFLNMYKFLIDSHMKRCDTKIIFVLMSKFDLQNWLHEMRPKLSEISQLLNYVFMGLENCNQPETTLLQDLFRRHLIHIYEHKFPEHYGEVLQKALTSSSDQKLMPVVLIDLLNSLLIRSNTEILASSSNFTPTSDQLTHFATQQNLFSFSEISDTIKMFARHFQGERLQHGLHGLYPKHKNYCQAFSLWFSFFGHAATASAICSYNNALGDTICDILFEALAEMYAPWLVIYSGQSLQQYTANWIRQLIANGKLLYPWSELHTESAKIMICSFINCLQYVLDSLPVSSGIMGHVFNWYFCNFTSQDVTNYIRAPLHASLVLLPWERFEPQLQHIGLMLKILQEYLPECHSFFGHVFLRIKWKSWFRDIFNSFNAEKQGIAMQLVLTIFIQISFEPYIHEDELTHKILEESLNYPWHLVEYQGLESIFNWIVLSVEPAIILKIPTESNNVDKGVLRLLQLASGMLISNQASWSSTCLTKSKRLLYVRTIVRLLRTCATKHNKLLATKEGVQTFTNAVEELIENCEETALTNNNSRKETETEAQHLAIEIIGSLSSQTELTSKLFIDAIITWQTKCNAGSPMLCGMLHAIGMSKALSHNMHALLEATIHNYFRQSDGVKDIHCPAWTVLLQKLRNVIDLLDLPKLLGGPYLLSMHCYILHKIGNTADVGSKITFLQDISQLLEGVKTNETTEAKIAVIWGSIISYGCKILEISENAKKPLLMLARYLQVISVQSEGWGEGLLEVIGLKRGSISNKRKILTRCLSCIIFALFPDNSIAEPKYSQEFLLSLEDLKVASINKKYADVKVEATMAIGLIEENFTTKSEEVIEKIYNIICLLYNDCFLTNLLEVWSL